MSCETPNDVIDDAAVEVVFVEGLIDLLVLVEPVVRVDRVEAAKARIADGDHPSAEVLARHLL
jgi:hypothetical protein